MWGLQMGNHHILQFTFFQSLTFQWGRAPGGERLVGAQAPSPSPLGYTIDPSTILYLINQAVPTRAKVAEISKL